MAQYAVFYLCRSSNDPRFSRAFLKSLATHRPGAEFDLVYVLKGFEPNETDSNLLAFREFSPQPVHEVRVSDDLYPTQVLLDTAAMMQYDKILFLISYSRVLAPNWLSIYLNAFDHIPSCGIVGATGGYERLENSQPFPNVNIRTNGFMVEAKLIASCDRGNLATKFGGNLFEAGPNSLTRQIVRRGLVPVVVDRLGQPWTAEAWPISRTFRSGNQEGLLIADNRTYDYASASAKRRRKLARLNWGETSMISRPTLIGRLRSMIDWRWPGTMPSSCARRF